MFRRSPKLLLLVSLVALGLQACDDGTHHGITGPRLAVTAEPAPLVPRIIAPATTDPAIDWVPATNPLINHHYVWLDPSAHPNAKLFVFMAGTGGRPRGYQPVQQEAARLGYYSIGLMYQNDVAVAAVCPGSADPNCSGDFRLEVIDGINHSPHISVTQANGIDNRLTKLLLYLDQEFPNEEWSRFLDEVAAPKWSQIAVGGHSQGAGQAALIGRMRTVDRVVMLSGPPDATVPGQPDAWVSIGMTPAAHYFGLVHLRDHFLPGISPNWTALEMERFGAPFLVDVGGPPPGQPHILVTDVEPQGGYATPNPHRSSAIDLSTPLAPDGTPALRDAWRYLLGERGAVGGH